MTHCIVCYYHAENNHWEQSGAPVCLPPSPMCTSFYVEARDQLVSVLNAESSLPFNMGQSIETENNKEGMFHHFYSGVWINDAVPLPDPVL